MGKIKAQIFNGLKLIADCSLDIMPQVGYLLRDGMIFYRVEEIIICLDETPNMSGQTRVNIVTKIEKSEGQKN